MSVMGLDWLCENLDVLILLVENYWCMGLDIPNVKAGFPA
jgi:hypothetical protein